MKQREKDVIDTRVGQFEANVLCRLARPSRLLRCYPHGGKRMTLPPHDGVGSALLFKDR